MLRASCTVPHAPWDGSPSPIHTIPMYVQPYVCMLGPRGDIEPPSPKIVAPVIPPLESAMFVPKKIHIFCAIVSGYVLLAYAVVTFCISISFENRVVNFYTFCPFFS